MARGARCGPSQSCRGGANSGRRHSSQRTWLISLLLTRPALLRICSDSRATMSTRREPRVAQNTRVWVSGRDSRGHEFRQTAKLTDASWLGGRLAEIRCLQAPGQVLEVRHRGKSQQFSVVWIDEVSGLAGIRSLNPAESMF